MYGCFSEAVTSRLSIGLGKSRAEHRLVSEELSLSCGHLKRNLGLVESLGSTKLFRNTLATVSRGLLLPDH